jgi:predicted neuraminidase
MRRAGLRWCLIAAAVLLNVLPALHWGKPTGGSGAVFELPPAVSTGAAAPKFEEELINPDSGQAMSHVASLCELPDGKLAAVWYAGSREGARDVGIYFATRERGAARWSTPRAILTPGLAAVELGRSVRKVGNPVIFGDDAGKLWLVYVTINVGGWSGSSLNLTSSRDGGVSWERSRRLTLSPFFNISELVRNRPVRLSDGSWLVPIYHELFGKFGEVLRLQETRGEPCATKMRINGGRSGFQPTVAPVGTNAAIALLRDCGSQRRIALAKTEDCGRTWSSPQALDLPNPDSGLAALRLADGRLLLAFNDTTARRENLRLAVSSDDGQTWQRAGTLAQEAKAEFSYPYLIQARDGELHLVYTWKRKGIKHLTFNVAWLDAQLTKDSK